MRILWDLRLFSLPYATRGVGAVTRRFLQPLRDTLDEHEVYILGESQAVPHECVPRNCRFIEYARDSWKQDLFVIPYILKTHRIDICHFWIALGPIHRIGLPAYLPCFGVATVIDLGVALWHDIPFLRNKSKTFFWKAQQLCVKNFQAIHFYSHAVKKDYQALYKTSQRMLVTYPPLPTWEKVSPRKRKPYIVTLGGAPHKNLKRTICAFEEIRTRYPKCVLFVAGHTEKDELPEKMPHNVRFVSMDRYPELLAKSSLFVSASYHEGFGLPMLEAMHMSCPLVLSAIPTHLEIARGHAAFVQPFSIRSIADGMMEVLSNTRLWGTKSMEASSAYRSASADSADKTLFFYHEGLHA